MPRAFLGDPVRRLALCDPGLAWTLPHRSDPRFAAGCGAQRARRHVAHGPEATAWIVRVLPPIPGLAWVPFATIWFGVNPSATASSSPSACSGWSSSRRGAIRGAARDLIEVADAVDIRSPWQRLSQMLLPAVMPGRRKAQEMLDLVGPGPLAPCWPHQLSGGQRQRVSRARSSPNSGWGSAPARSATARRSEWSLPSLRAQQSNPGGRRALSLLDCFVADAPRNDGDCL